MTTIACDREFVRADVRVCMWVCSSVLIMKRNEQRRSCSQNTFIHP